MLQLKHLLLLILTVIVLLQGYRAATFTNPGESPYPEIRKQQQDYRFIYAAGKTWAKGLSPHIPENFRQVYIDEFHDSNPSEGWVSYPPTLALIALPVGLLPWKESIIVYDLMNDLSFILCLLFADWIFAKVLNISRLDTRLLIGLICVAAMGTHNGVLSTGQTSLVSLAGILGAFYFWLKSSPLKSSLCLLFASIKPQLCALPMLFLFCENYRILIWTGVCLALLTLLTVIPTWEPGIFSGYLHSMLLREETPFNQMSNLSVPHRIAYLLGGKSWRLLPELIGLIIFTIYYYLLRKKKQDPEPQLYLINLTLVLTLAFFPLHPYDYCIALLPLLFLTFLRKELLLASLPALVVLIRPSIPFYLLQKIHLFSPTTTFSDFFILATFICLVPLYLGIIFSLVLRSNKVLHSS